MIARGRVLRLAMGSASNITDDELDELCRTYVDKLDAEEACRGRVNAALKREPSDCPPEYQKGFQDGYVLAQSMPETTAGAMVKIMRRLGIVGASAGEIADQVCKRLDGCEEIIDRQRRGR
jgi:hypothetical protein